MVKDWQTLASKLFCFCIFALCGYLFFEYLLLPLAPFLLAFILSFIVYKISLRASGITGIRYSLCAFFIVTVFFCALGYGAFALCRHLVLELSGLLSALSGGGIISLVPVSIGEAPIIGGVVDHAVDMLGENTDRLVKELLTRAYELAGTFLGKVIRTSPTFFLSVFAFVISAYYFSMDMKSIRSFLLGMFCSKSAEPLKKIKQSALFAVAGYIKAYAWLFLLTFCEVLVGLLIIYPKVAVIGAICIACVDILPVFGAGAVLIPWGILSLLSGGIFKGVGMIALYIIITVVRQIAEPRIVGKKMGLHPLATLITMMLGARLFGIGGMLILPLALSVAVNAMKKQ